MLRGLVESLTQAYLDNNTVRIRQLSNNISGIVNSNISKRVKPPTTANLLQKQGYIFNNASTRQNLIQNINATATPLNNASLSAFFKGSNKYNIVLSNEKKKVIRKKTQSIAAAKNAAAKAAKNAASRYFVMKSRRERTRVATEARAKARAEAQAVKNAAKAKAQAAAEAQAVKNAAKAKARAEARAAIEKSENATRQMEELAKQTNQLLRKNGLRRMYNNNIDQEIHKLEQVNKTQRNFNSIRNLKEEQQLRRNNPNRGPRRNPLFVSTV
jgi:hypothetical protein